MRRLSLDSTDSGYEGGPRFRGAVLSWHNMRLWVPAKAEDQLKSVQRWVGDAQSYRTAAPMATEDVDELESATAGPPSPRGGAGGGAVGARGGAVSFEKQILRDVSGTARRGGLTALMGPSGAGKTSLLDCLACRKPMHRVEGVVRVNGRPCTPGTMRAVSGYVPQHDVLPGVLTVREHLLFHARLRCPPSMGDRDRRSRVHDVITNLGLTKCADTVIGNEFKRGLSGGEKRRVSVAEELVVEPGILFLDGRLLAAPAPRLLSSLARAPAAHTRALPPLHAQSPRRGSTRPRRCQSAAPWATSRGGAPLCFCPSTSPARTSSTCSTAW